MRFLRSFFLSLRAITVNRDVTIYIPSDFQIESREGKIVRDDSGSVLLFARRMLVIEIVVSDYNSVCVGQFVARR